MKRTLLVLLLFVLAVALIPLMGLTASDGETAAADSSDILPAAASTDESTPTSPTADEPGGETFLVLDEADGSLLTLSARDYVLGALMTEMPASWDPEALKAQAVAIHTYALHVKALRSADPLPELGGADFSVNSAARSGYMTDEQAKAVWGGDYAAYKQKLSDAVDAVLPQILTYGGAPISACYHAISPGKTESSENAFSAAVPWLTSVDSSWDTAAAGYETLVSFSPDELAALLAAGDGGFAAAGQPETWYAGDAVCSDAGTVLSLTLGGTRFSGTQLRTLLGLRSAAFTLAYADGKFVFTVHGYGHGVGLSQYGAQSMALTGADYTEILAHYYPGAALETKS